MPAWIHSDPNASDGYWAGEGEQRPCARGERCASRDRNNQPAPGPRVLCTADRDILIAVLEKLPEMYVELHLKLGERGAGSSDVRVSGGSKTPPLPWRPDINALQARIVEELASWEFRVRTIASRYLTAMELPRRDSVAMSTACNTLARNVDILLALEPEPMNRTVPESAVPALPEDTDGHVRPAGWAILRKELGGGDAAVEIFALFEACKSKLGWRRQHEDLLTPCWTCDQRMLRRWDGAVGLADHVECRNAECRDRYEGERLVRLMAHEERAQQQRARKQAS